MSLTLQQWDTFLPELKNRNCCLLLGPEISCINRNAKPSVSVLEAFSEYIKIKLDLLGITYNPAINNFHYRANKLINSQYPDRPFLFETEITNFEQGILLQPHPYFNQLVKLPFNTIINMVPDGLIAQALQQGGYEFVDEYYDYNNPIQREMTATDEMLLLYNLFGKYNIPSSVAVTEKDQLRQIKNMVAGLPPIPDIITTRFNDKNKKKSFLLLGFNFNEWHFRLVIDALKIPKPVYSYYPVYSKNHQVAFLTQVIFIRNSMELILLYLIQLPS